MNAIRIMIVEDDPDWIKAMTAFLNKEEDLLVVGTAQTREEAVRMAVTVEYDVVLMDVCLTEGQPDGIYAAMELLDVRETKVIMLTSIEDEEIIKQSFTAGAVQYVVKTNYRALPDTIRSVSGGNQPIEVLLKEFARLKREEQLQDLTGAEREVFELLESGHTQAEIGRKLYKAESTLKNQVNKILKKLGVKSSREAVDKVKRKGILPSAARDSDQQGRSRK